VPFLMQLALDAFNQVFVEPLRNASPPVIPPDRLPGFISEVFWNMDNILTYHQRMLYALLSRQREQHPLVQSVADVILDSKFCLTCPLHSSFLHQPLYCFAQNTNLTSSTTLWRRLVIEQNSNEIGSIKPLSSPVPLIQGFVNGT
jgi:hypothetical protein